MPYWTRSVGIILLILGFCFIEYSEKKESFREGMKAGVNMFLEVLEESSQGQKDKTTTEQAIQSPEDKVI